MAEIVCFGEIMLRLNPEGYLKFTQANKFEASYAGGEANVAVSLANYGITSAFVSKIPTGGIGQAAVNELRKYGVDTSNIIRGGERLGIYFLEKGASQRPSSVIYDRKHSAIATASADEFDWNKIFDGAKWFHFTGITPALSQTASDACLKACKTANEMGITVSCDINYRKNLWSKEDAGKVMSELMRYVDVCVGNEEDAETVFGTKASNTDVETGMLNPEGYKEVANRLADRFGFKKVAVTLRGSISASDNNWAAMLYDGKKYYFSRNYLIHIVDRVGGGDSFAGGLIYALHKDYNPQEAVEFAAAASCLKHTVEFDFNQATVADVEGLLKGGGSGRVQR